MLWCGTPERAQKMRDALSEEYLPVRPLPAKLEGFTDIAVLDETLEKGFVLHENKLAVIGSSDLFPKAAGARRIKRKRGDLFFAPEIGDFAVHETYGVGKVTGVERIETTDGTKEYVSLVYKGGDVLHVPVESMDVLSKYMGGDEPTLSKIGGGEFERVKARVRASLKKLAFDLKALYAERQEKKGYVFPDYFEEMDEFIAAFPYEDTPDQAHPPRRSSQICAPKRSWTACFAATWDSERRKSPCAPCICACWRADRRRSCVRPPYSPSSTSRRRPNA